MAEKPTLVILPGWGGSHYTWQEFTTLASRHFNVRCIDLPCFGDEPCPTEVWGVEEYADFVRDKISDFPALGGTPPTGGGRFQISDLVLLGHSFGGQVAVSLAAKHPELINKLILSGAAVVRPNRAVRRAISQCVAAVGRGVISLPWLRRYEDLIKKMFYCLIDSTDYLETSGIKREIYKKIIRQDGTLLLSKIKIPTLVVWGARDRMTPTRHGQRIAQLITRAQWCLFSGAHHGLHREIPEKLLSVIQDFCTK